MIIHRYMHDGSTIHALELMVMRAEFCNQSIKLQSSGGDCWAFSAYLSPLEKGSLPDSNEGSVASMGILPAEPSQDFVIEYAVCSHPDCIPVLTPLHDLDDYICFATGEHLCASCIDVHRPACGPCTWRLEQQREQILKGTPVLDLEAWGKDQQ